MIFIDEHPTLVYVGVAVGVVTLFLVAVVLAVIVRRYKARASKDDLPGAVVYGSAAWYNRQQIRPVLSQLPCKTTSPRDSLYKHSRISSDSLYAYSPTGYESPILGRKSPLLGHKSPLLGRKSPLLEHKLNQSVQSFSSASGQVGSLTSVNSHVDSSSCSLDSPTRDFTKSRSEDIVVTPVSGRVDTDSQCSTDSATHLQSLASVEVSMVWSCDTFSVTFSNLSNLPAKVARSSLVASVTLKSSGGSATVSQALPDSTPYPTTSLSTLSLPSLHKGHGTKKPPKPHFAQVFTFRDVSFQDVRASDLLLEVKTKRTGLVGGGRVVGVGAYSLHTSCLSPHVPLIVALKLTSNSKVRSPSTAPPSDAALQLSLLYQTTGPTRARVKVLVLRARALRHTKSWGQYRVEVSVRGGGRHITTHRTPLVSSTTHPVWNHALLLDVEQEQVAMLSLEVFVVRIGRTRRRSVLGSCCVGGSSADEHWSRVIKKEGREIAYWHGLT